MQKLITFHSFRRGAGKSTLASNIAALIAQSGQRVMVVDMDLQEPSLHLFFGLSNQDFTLTLNDFLCRGQTIQPAVVDVSVGSNVFNPGRLFLLPASDHAKDVMEALRSSVDFERLSCGMNELADVLQLDVIILDTCAGLNENTLTTIAMAHTLVEILRPLQQDYQGTGVTVEVARNLQLPSIYLVLNDTPISLDFAQARQELMDIYGFPVGEIFPHSEEFMSIASTGLFINHYPAHPITQQLRDFSKQLLA